MASINRNGINAGDNATLLLVGGVAAMAYFGVLNPLLKAFGIKDTQKDKEEAAVLQANEKAIGWDPNYYKTLAGKKKIILFGNQADLDAFGKTIWWAKGLTLNDDEEAVYGVLRKMPSQAHLSQFANAFLAKYKTDLLGYLKSFLSSADHFWAKNEMAEVARIVASKPPYIEVKK